VISIEKNHKSLEIAPKGSEVCIQIASINGEAPKMYGRHFDANDLLISKVTKTIEL
jgi:translation initiation factor 5B